MESHQVFQDVCDAMADPAFYTHPVTRVECRETHISAVFLAGDWVYKLKKPVDFGFLDFRTLEARRHFCEREVVLNQRLTRGVYEKVVNICRDETGRFFLDHGRPVEYAVKMRRLPDASSLMELVKRQAVSCDDLELLGGHLAGFYSQSAKSSEIDHYGTPEVVAFNMEENFQQIEPFVDELLERERWEFIREASRAFFRNWHKLFENRVRRGYIRDGHGDLRAEHVYFSEGIQIIDCVEFNDRFRYGDVVSDLSFLHMDLEALGSPDASTVIMSAYTAHSEDHEFYSLLDFYAAYRAIVKVKVACLRYTEIEAPEAQLPLKETARAYLEQAYRYALQFGRLTLWVFCGLPATGKSALSKRLSEALSLTLFQSDRIRKEGKDHLTLHAEVVPIDQGIYRLAMRQRVYAQMLALAQEELKKGHPVILDGTFSLSKWREEARQLAEDLDTNLIFVECVCREETLRERLKQREQRLNISDARLQHLPVMVKTFEALGEVPSDSYIRLDTERPFDKTFLELLAEGYARKCAQVKQLLAKVNGKRSRDRDW
jgi:aminoglycoside phosphotransferase family enzyme/predicted kinase